MKYLFHVDVELIRRTDAINLIKMREKWSINIVSQYPVSDLGIFPAIRGLVYDDVPLARVTSLLGKLRLRLGKDVHGRPDRHDAGPNSRLMHQFPVDAPTKFRTSSPLSGD